MILDILWPQAVAFVAVVLYGSFFEWTLHKYFMHRRAFIPYPFELHALIHHKIFQADETFHAQNEKMKEHVTFVPRDYLILLCVNAPVFFAFEWITGISIVVGGSLAILSYLLMFDFLHWTFHVPNNHVYEKLGPFRWIKRHHLLHHKYQNRNLNVVFPLADLVLGTLVTKPRENATVLEV